MCRGELLPGNCPGSSREQVHLTGYGRETARATEERLARTVPGVDCSSSLLWRIHSSLSRPALRPPYFMVTSSLVFFFFPLLLPPPPPLLLRPPPDLLSRSWKKSFRGHEMTFATLRALHAIIGTAIDDIERVYRPNTYNLASPPRPVAPAPSSPKPERPPRSPHRRTHLPSPPSYSPSPPPRPESRSCSPSVSSQCSHTIDIASLPSPISVKFAAPPKPTLKPRARSQTLPVSLRPLASKGDKKSATTDDIPPVPDIVLDWPDIDKPFPRPSQPPANNGATLAHANASEPQSTPQKWKSEQEEALTTNPEVINAVNRIVAACAHLSACVQRPFLTLCDATLGVRRVPFSLNFLSDHSSSIIYLLVCGF